MVEGAIMEQRPAAAATLSSNAINYVPPSEQAKKLFRLTKYEPCTIEDMAKIIKNEISLRSRLASDGVNCPLCMCELFEGVNFNDEASVGVAVTSQIMNKTPPVDHVVKMKNCKGHYYHRQCLES